MTKEQIIKQVLQKLSNYDRLCDRLKATEAACPGGGLSDDLRGYKDTALQNITALATNFVLLVMNEAKDKEIEQQNNWREDKED